MDKILICPSQKRIYYTKFDARDAKKHIARKFRSSQRVYLCNLCGYYHLTRNRLNIRQQLKLELFHRLIVQEVIKPIEVYGNGLKLYEIRYKGYSHLVGYNGDMVTVLYWEKIENNHS